MPMTEAERDAGMKALSWFSWNFKGFRDQKLRWEDAFRDAMDKTIDQLDAEVKEAEE